MATTRRNLQLDDLTEGDFIEVQDGLGRQRGYYAGLRRVGGAWFVAILQDLSFHEEKDLPIYIPSRSVLGYRILKAVSRQPEHEEREAG